MVLQYLKEVEEELNSGIIFITHNLDMAKQVGVDKILVLNNGGATLYNSSEELENISKVGFKLIK